jgi:hypothetical protein
MDNHASRAKQSIVHVGVVSHNFLLAYSCHEHYLNIDLHGTHVLSASGLKLVPNLLDNGEHSSPDWNTYMG